MSLLELIKGGFANINRYCIRIDCVDVKIFHTSLSNAERTFGWLCDRAKKHCASYDDCFAKKFDIVIYDRKEKKIIKQKTAKVESCGYFPTMPYYGVRQVFRDVIDRYSTEGRIEFTLKYIALPVILFGVVFYLGESKRKRQMEDRWKGFDASVKYNPIVIPAGNCDVTEKSADDKIHGVDSWSDYNGDYKKCRKAMVKRFEQIYGQKKYLCSPERTYIRIDKDTLVLSSQSFRDYDNIKWAISSYVMFFRDCNFHTVDFMQVDAGGNPVKRFKFDDSWSLIGPGGHKIPYNKVKDFEF